MNGLGGRNRNGEKSDRAVEKRELAYHGVLPSVAGGELHRSLICTLMDGP